MCKICIQKTSDFTIEGTLSSFSEKKAGLKQGDPLSPILFGITKVIQSIKNGS